MTENDAQPIADLIEQALTANREVITKLTQQPQRGGDDVAALERSARGTALLHELRLGIDQLNKLLPFKG